MNKQIMLLIMSMGGSLPTPAKESAHVHGQGRIHISQKNRSWYVQLILPTADVLGFEHAPDTAVQIEAVSE
ncbi:DUF2796 domain-containing protein [Paraglaciecola sp.]|uniref:ZrgA family zinc uptake protein n=1 Tax=Paraglaciecola sp. TaxID=1920173 RepID=UPI0030F49A4F